MKFYLLDNLNKVRLSTRPNNDRLKDIENYNDLQLWSLVKLNNREAFEILYRRHWSRLLISAYNVLKDREVSKDIVQDVFTDLWVKRRTTFISSMSGYLKVSVRNQVFKQLRRGKIALEHIKGLDIVSFVDATEQMVNFNQLNETYDRSVARLPERCREIFKMSRNENLTVKEIAAKLDISPKTVENQITKALKHLRKSMSDLILVLAIIWLI